MSPVRLLLADDHSIVRRGLASLLAASGRFVVVAEARDGEEALTMLETTAVDIAVLDLYMPRLNGLETLRRILKQFPQVRVIVLSMYDDEQFVAQALKDGARGYVLKQSLEEELFTALERVVAGGKYVSEAIKLAGSNHKQADKPLLTDREREILNLIAAGHTTQQSAEILSISGHTATRHRANLMQKLNVHTQVELIRAAVERGLILLAKPPGE